MLMNWFRLLGRSKESHRSIKLKWSPLWKFRAKEKQEPKKKTFLMAVVYLFLYKYMNRMNGRFCNKWVFPTFLALFLNLVI